MVPIPRTPSSKRFKARLPDPSHPLSLAKKLSVWPPNILGNLVLMVLYCAMLFPTLAVGLLDFKVYVVLALHQEPDCSAQWQRIPTVPSRRVSLQCPAAEYPCSAKPPSIPAVPNCRVSLQRPTAEYPCSALPQSCPIFQETLHLLSNKSFRVGILHYTILYYTILS